MENSRNPSRTVEAKPSSCFAMTIESGENDNNIRGLSVRGGGQEKPSKLRKKLFRELVAE